MIWRILVEGFLSFDIAPDYFSTHILQLYWMRWFFISQDSVFSLQIYAKRLRLLNCHSFFKYSCPKAPRLSPSRKLPVHVSLAMVSLDKVIIWFDQVQVKRAGSIPSPGFGFGPLKYMLESYRLLLLYRVVKCDNGQSF